jgi:O-antigen ligase
MIPMLIPKAGWLVIFAIGFPFVLYKALRDPAWSTMAAVYVYFAIPPAEFGAPGFPYQPAFFGLAILGAFRYYRLFNSWGQDEITDAGIVVAKEAIALVQGKMIEALVHAGVHGKIRGEIRRAAIEASEQEAIDLVERRAPSSISVAVRRAVQTVLNAAADAGEKEALAALEGQVGKPKGQIHAALSARVPQAMQEAMEKALAPTVRENVQRTVESFEKDSEKMEKNAGRGPLGIPVPKGPIGGVLTNPGIWAHLGFATLTYVGAKNALYDTGVGMERFTVCLLLIPNILAIVASIRNARHFFMFVLAWLFGTWHICMNGVMYWLSYGGRADNAGGQGGESNFLGAIICAVCPVAFGLALNLKDPRFRLAALGGAGCFVLGVLASGSRAGLLAMFAGLGYWMMMTNRKTIALGVMFIAAAGFLVVAPDDFYERMGTILGEKDNNPWVKNEVEASKHERIVLWDLAIKIFKQHPGTGIGPMNYPRVSAEETNFTDAYQGRRGLQAHNTWLQLLAEYGIVGGIVWGGAFFFSIVCYFRARMRMRHYPGYEWFGALCLGLESGALSTAVVISFNSFQWYDYLYWHFIAGPLALEIANSTAERLEWLKPAKLDDIRPPPRYGPPKRDGLDLHDIDLAETAPISSTTRV